MSHKPLNTKFYGDDLRYFVGEVIDVADPYPTPLGRVQVRIVGVHDSPHFERADYPWASVMIPTTEGGLITGFPPAIDIGAQVFGIFLDGKSSQMPLVLGTIPFQVQDYRAQAVNAFGDGGDGSVNTAGFDPEAPAGYSGPIATPLPPTENDRIAYTHFMDTYGSDSLARGIIGNIIVESSNWDADVIAFDRRGDAGTAYGICQWRGSRMHGPQGLIAFAEAQSLNPTDVSTQLRFINYELEQVSAAVNSSVLGELLQCTTPAQAAVHFCRKYERPQVVGGTSRFPDPPYGSGPLNIPMRHSEERRISYAEREIS